MFSIDAARSPSASVLRIGSGQGKRRLRKTNQATALCRLSGEARSDTTTSTSTASPIANAVVLVRASAVAKTIAVRCTAFSLDRFGLMENGPTRLAISIINGANSVEAVQDGRIHVEKINWPFLQAGGSADEYVAGLQMAIDRGWLDIHRSGTYVKFTPAGAELFA